MKKLHMLVGISLCVLTMMLTTVNAQPSYYSGLGTNNFEVGLYHNVTLEVSKPTELLIAMVENTGNVNVSLAISPIVQYKNGNVSLQNPSFFECNYYGCEYYSRQPIEYPFFLMPETKIDIYANMTLNDFGSYEIRFAWNATNQIPYDYGGQSLSTPGGKATALILCEPMIPFLVFGLEPSHATLIVVIAIATDLSVGIFVKYKLHHRKKLLNLKTPNVIAEKKKAKNEYMRNYMREKRRKQREPQSQPS